MNKKNLIKFSLFFFMPAVLVGILYLPYQLLLIQTNERAHPGCAQNL